MTIREIKEELEGHEVLSLHCEGTVYVRGGLAYRYGAVVHTCDWQTLWKEYVEQELGPCYMEDLKDEFGAIGAATTEVK